MFRYLFCVLLLLAVVPPVRAQSGFFQGRWYLGLHDLKKVENGSGCVFTLNRQPDATWQLVYLQKNCTGNVPPAGSYTVQNGTLVQGDWVLEANHTSITYIYKDVYTEFRPVVTDSIVGAMIANAANNIDSAVVRKPYKTALLRRSIATMNKALQMDSRCVVCMVNASIAWMQLGQLDSAASYYLLGFTTDSTNTHLPEVKESIRDHILTMAWEKYGKKGQLEKAIECFKNSLTIDPSYAETYYNLGGAYYTLGNKEQARFYFKKALQLNPNHEQAKQGYEAAGGE